MKCDELKSFNCVDSDLQEFCEPRLVYPKSEVDAAIAELKEVAIDACLERDDNQKVIDELEAENQRLVKCCKEYDSRQRIDERIKANASKQLRATKRALWLARKAHAVAMFSYWDSHYRDNPNAVYRNRTIDWLRNRWLLILDAIIKKEKEYK